MTDLPVLGALKHKMRWLTARQEVIAANVAQADTPGYKAQDLERPNFATQMYRETGGAMKRSHARHLRAMEQGAGIASRPEEQASWITSPDGNSVVLEQEMMKMSETVGEYRAAANIYSKSMGMLRMAIGK